MLNPSGEDSMLLIALSVFRIISRISSGFLAASKVCRRMPVSLSIWASSGFRSMISRIWGLFIIKLRIRSGLFIKFWMAGIFIISLIILGFWVNCCCTCSNSGNPAPNNPDAPVPPKLPKPSPGNKGDLMPAAPMPPLSSELAPCLTPEPGGRGLPAVAAVVAEAVPPVAGVDAAGAKPRTMWTVWSACKPSTTEKRKIKRSMVYHSKKTKKSIDNHYNDVLSNWNHGKGLKKYQAWLHQTGMPSNTCGIWCNNVSKFFLFGISWKLGKKIKYTKILQILKFFIRSKTHLLFPLELLFSFPFSFLNFLTWNPQIPPNNQKKTENRSLKLQKLDKTTTCK